jgi:Clp amino terminal domain, pathogenicity island component
VIEIVGYGGAGAVSQMPLTPRAVRVLQLAAGEAVRLGRADADTEHVLLALIDEGERVGARILRDAGADARAIRGLVTDMAGGMRPASEPLVSDMAGEVRRASEPLVSDMPGGVRPASEPPVPGTIAEIEVDLGWRGRSIALAALGAAVFGRSAFDPRRTGALSIEMQVLACLVLGAGAPDRIAVRWLAPTVPGVDDV